MLGATVITLLLGFAVAVPLGFHALVATAQVATPTVQNGQGSSPAAALQSAPSAEPVASTEGPPGGSAHWVEVFGDEFDGDRLDVTKWQSNRYGGTSDDGTFNPASESSFFSPRNVEVKDGAAVLAVRPQAATLDGVSYSYSTGIITSENSFLAKDGDYVEARIRIPQGPGLFPGFWTIPGDRWPPEVDIAEFYNTAIESHPTGVYHTADGKNPHIVYGDPTVDYRDSWHTYGMLRAAGKIVLYLDGIPYPLPVTAADSLPQYLILNLSVYRGAAPAPGTQMLIDWVRVWRPDAGSCGGRACSASR